MSTKTGGKGDLQCTFAFFSASGASASSSTSLLCGADATRLLGCGLSVSCEEGEAPEALSSRPVRWRSHAGGAGVGNDRRRAGKGTGAGAAGEGAAEEEGQEQEQGMLRSI
eukprot:scaffold1748_cov123-Isochrysis_galbana.AAC.2